MGNLGSRSLWWRVIFFLPLTTFSQLIQYHTTFSASKQHRGKVVELVTESFFFQTFNSLALFELNTNLCCFWCKRYRLKFLQYQLIRCPSQLEEKATAIPILPLKSLCWQCPLKHTIINYKWHTVINTILPSKTSAFDFAGQPVLMEA